jgi:hypothetical protein
MCEGETTMKKSISLVLMGILLSGSAMVMAQTVPEVDQTGEHEGAFGNDTAETANTPEGTEAKEPAGTPEGTESASEPVEAPAPTG